MTSDEKAIKRNKVILELRATTEKNSPNYLLKVFDQACLGLYSLTYAILAMIAYLAVTHKKSDRKNE